MHETARRRRLVFRSGKAFCPSHANDTFTQTTQRNCLHRHSSSTKRTKSCALRCEFKTQQHASIHSNPTTSLKETTAMRPHHSRNKSKPRQCQYICTIPLLSPEAALCILDARRGCGKAGGCMSNDPERCPARSTAFGCILLRPCCCH